MTLLAFQSVSHAYGGAPLLEDADFSLEEGERVALVGRNGSGKSTLLRILAGELRPDRGSVFRSPGLRVARLEQDVPAGLEGTVAEVVASGFVAHDGHDESWHREHRLDRLLHECGLDGDAPVASLSGGLRRRVLLARALACDPDVLLLDEPTNHLDVPSIEDLEERLRRARVALVFVTHDRAFLRRLATRIVELDRGRLHGWACDYDTFVARRAAQDEVEARQRALEDKELAREETWIRKSVRAQRSRPQARVEALLKRREERRARRERVGDVRLRLADAGRGGDKVVETEGITFAWPGRAPVVRGLSTTIWRGDRIGILGPNGCGKTTLVRLLLGELAPQEGTVRLGTGLEVVYFDQLRAELDDRRTVADTVADGATTVSVGGRQQHVISYLQDFLFAPDRARSTVGMLSGGERHRLLLARLFTRPANLLVLDEPTNDLDLETLELLEELLASFEGTLLVVSHDREFLRRVVTGTLAILPDGTLEEGTGDEIGAPRASRVAAAEGAAARPAQPAPARPAPTPRKLSMKERAELDALPDRIEALEREQAEATVSLGDPALYQRDPAAAPRLKARLAAIEDELAQAMTRWEELEARR